MLGQVGRKQRPRALPDWRRLGGGRRARRLAQNRRRWNERERERVECSIFEEEDGGGRAFLNLCPRMPLVIPICNASNPLIARNFDVTVQHRAMGIDGASRLHPEYLCLPLILLFALLVSLTPTSVSDHGKIVPSGDMYIYIYGDNYNNLGLYLIHICEK